MNGGNATPKRVCPEAKGGNPTMGRSMLWDRNPFREIITNGKSQEKKPETPAIT